MQDRQPGAPGQYKALLTAAEFQKMQAGAQFTITMTRDDQPIVEGTPYSKAAVLPDDLAGIICPDVVNPTPADAFSALCTGKAPAKFGLGSQSNGLGDYWENDANNATMCGWYGFSSTAKNTPFPYGVILTSDRLGVGQIQLAFSHLNDGIHKNTMAIRSKIDPNWSEWEYINPPVRTGVACRTTKRYNGKVVYVKLLETGSLPANSYKDVAIGDTVSEIVDLKIRIKSASSAFRSFLPTANINATASTEKVRIYSMNTDSSAYSGVIYIEYTKD